MSYPKTYVRYLNLPKIPNEVLASINWNFTQYEFKNGLKYWTDSFNQQVNTWCQHNICDSMYFAFNLFYENLSIHKDKGTKTKLNYILDPGGSSVFTEFYDEDKTTLLERVQIETHRWYIFKADAYHRVTGIQPGATRFMVTSQVFE